MFGKREKLSHGERKVLFASVVLGIVASSCSIQSTQNDTNPTIPPVEGRTVTGSTLRDVTYYENGTRKVTVVDERGYFIADIYSTCDGEDLLDVTSDDEFGATTVRSVGHVACVDGALTPEDF